MRHPLTILLGQLTLATAVAVLAQPLPAAAAISHGVQPSAVAVDAGPRLAQENMPVETAERRHARMQEIQNDLEKNPNLVDDPEYLKHHPMFARMLEKHPQAKDQIKKDPKAFFQRMEERHQQKTGS